MKFVRERKEYKEQERQRVRDGGREEKRKLYCSTETEGRRKGGGRMLSFPCSFSVCMCLNSGGHVCMQITQRL